MIHPLHLQTPAYTAAAIPAQDPCVAPTGVDGTVAGGSGIDTTGTDTTGSGTTETGTTEVCVETPVTTSTSDDGVSIAVVVIAVLVAAALAALAGYLLGRRRNGAASRPSTPDRPGGPIVVVQPDPQTEAAREELINFLIELRDRTESDAMSARIGDALARVGVRTDDPTGQVFNAKGHVAQAPPLPTDDRTLDGKVAQIVQYGYSEGDHIRRAPTVVVWRARTGAPR